MITVHTKLFASLRNKVSGHQDWSQPLQVELEDGATVGDLLAHFDIAFPQAIVAVVGGTRRKIDWVLQDGDVVGLFPPVGGG